MPVSINRLRDVLHYDPETGGFTWKVMLSPTGTVGKAAGTRQSAGYTKIKIDNVMYYAHRLAWFYMTGDWPKAQIDHINAVRGDDRFCNLRQATHAENKHNSPLQKNNKSGHKGVSWYGQRNGWRADIRVSSVQKYLGTFPTPEDAAQAYAKAAQHYFGEFARLA